MRIYISDTIDKYWGVSAKSVRAQIESIKDKTEKLEVVINSPGGSIFEGLEIYHAIKSFAGESVVTIAGIAASMASVVALAGKKVVIAKGSMEMIHNPLTWMYGNANEMRKTAEDLDKIRDSILEIYMTKFTGTKDELIALLDAETYLTAEESLEYGLVSEIVDTYGQQSSFSFAACSKEFVQDSVKKMQEKISKEFSATTLQNSILEYNNTNGVQEMKFTMENLKAEAPDLINQIKAEAKAEFEATAKADLVLAVKAETKRIMDIQALAIQGQETIVAQAIESGKSAQDFAMDALKDAKAKGSELLKALANAETTKENIEGGEDKPEGEAQPEANKAYNAGAEIAKRFQGVK